MDKKTDNKTDNKKKGRVGQGIKIKKYEDIFDDDFKDNAEHLKDSGGSGESGAVSVSPSVLRDFKNHPFKVDGKGIYELMESIRGHGILSPIIIRPGDEPGVYEIISGHRRKYCAVQLGFETVPVIIKDVDDDEAILAMVDSNIQREDILPSEKAFAYKMKLEAIKRQGERTELTCRQVVDKLKSADKVGKENNESGRQIQRYIRLTELPAALLRAVDIKKMSFNAGVELSFLDKEDKKAVERAAAAIKRFPSLAQAKRIREIAVESDGITVESVIDVMMETKAEKAHNEKVDFERDEIRAFFPKDFTAKQIEEAIIGILRDIEKVLIKTAANKEN